MFIAALYSTIGSTLWSEIFAPMDVNLIRQLVWLDYRLALIFLVIAPIGLLIWAIRVDSQAIKRSLIVYWRVASLVLITIYLALGGLGVAFISSILATVLIVLSLWFWQDLNEDIAASSKPVTPIYQGWRWAVTIYGSISTIFKLLFANCAFVSSDKLSEVCLTWFEPPVNFSKTFHNGVPVENLVFVGVVAGAVYMLYLFSFLAFSLPKTGRIAFRD